MSKVTAGKRLYSTASSVEVIVVKSADVILECAGAPMTDAKPQTPDASVSGQAIQLSKRYLDEKTGLLVLCTKGGAGPLTIEGRELQLQAAQALPSSD